MPKTISIVTICYNNLEELKSTCQSVDTQTLLPMEHWIINGSTSNEIEEYLRNSVQPAYRHWISERDHGIADAFNKGVLRCEGEICNMLNAGDYYIDNTVLQTVSAAFEHQPLITWLHAKYKLQRGGQWVIIGKPFEKSKLYRGMRSLCHQSMFIKTALHKQYGLYDTSLQNAMDYDFVCRIAAEPVFFIDKPVVVFAPGGVTNTRYLAALAEGKAVYIKHYGFSVKLILWQWRLRLLHWLLQSPIGKALYKLKLWMKLENA
jgi:glycosyltransferase involved in cell wall biosynthesis